MKISNDVSAVIYFKGKEYVKFLILYRYDPDKKENHYRLLKGGIKKGEKESNALLREIKEEAHLDNVTIIKKIEGYSYTASDVEHIVSVYLIKSNSKETIADSREEGKFIIKKIMWLKKEEAIDALNFMVEKNVLKSLPDIFN